MQVLNIPSRLALSTLGLAAAVAVSLPAFASPLDGVKSVSCEEGTTRFEIYPNAYRSPNPAVAALGPKTVVQNFYYGKFQWENLYIAKVDNASGEIVLSNETLYYQDRTKLFLIPGSDGSFSLSRVGSSFCYPGTTCEPSGRFTVSCSVSR